MRQKYYEDLGLNDGISILDLFKINIEEILKNAEKDNKKTNNQEEKEDNNK